MTTHDHDEDDELVDPTHTPSTVGEESCRLCIRDRAPLMGVLMALRSAHGGNPICQVNLSAEGFFVQWENESKNMQSTTIVRRDSFSDIQSFGSHSFGVHLAPLLDALSLFASSSSATSGPLVIKYGNVHRQLEFEVCETLDVGTETRLYAKLATMEAPSIGDWLEHWQGPDTSFHISSSLMRESIEDLEWPGGSVTMSISRDPPQIQLASTGQGSLSVQLPEQEITGLQCAEVQVRNGYHYRQLKGALAGLSSPSSEDSSVMTKVSVSGQGMLKVMHMINTTQQVQQQAGTTLYGNAGYFSTEQSNVQRAALVQYLLLPTEY